jgi:GAF domain-containing protein
VFDLKILDTAGEDRFDRLTREATARFKVPISTITIVEGDREWFKSAIGLNQKQGPRDISFCGHALLKEDIFIVEDTLQNPIFKDNPMVVGEPFIRFYAGKALYKRGANLPVGVFCIKDRVPRKMSLQDVNDFLALAERVEDELNLPKT